jgi:hypothetical protein
MPFKSLEEFENAIEVSPEEYDQYMLKTKQYISEDEAYAINEAASSLDLMEEIESMDLSYEDLSRGW